MAAAADMRGRGIQTSLKSETAMGGAGLEPATPSLSNVRGMWPVADSLEVSTEGLDPGCSMPAEIEPCVAPKTPSLARRQKQTRLRACKSRPGARDAGRSTLQ